MLFHRFIFKVNPSIAQQLIVKASEFETLDKTVEAARRVELSFQTLPAASNANQSLDEWKVTPANAFVSLNRHEISRSELPTTAEGLLHLRRNKSSVKVLSKIPQRHFKAT